MRSVGSALPMNWFDHSFASPDVTFTIETKKPARVCAWDPALRGNVDDSGISCNTGPESRFSTTTEQDLRIGINPSTITFLLQPPGPTIYTVSRSSRVKRAAYSS